MQVKNLKAYLANVGMTTREFCKLIDFDDKYISQILNGKKRVGYRLSKAVKLATGGVIDLPCRIPKYRQEEEKNHYPT